MHREPNFIQKLLLRAPLECLIALIAGFLAVWGLIHYYGYLHSPDGGLPFVPVIFAFGIWPYVIALVMALAYAFKAVVKSQR